MAITPELRKKFRSKQKSIYNQRWKACAFNRGANVMPSAFSLSPDNLLRFLQLRGVPTSAGEIAKGLSLRKSDTRPLFKMLAKLKKRRVIEELPGGRYGLPGRKADRRSEERRVGKEGRVGW